MPDAPAPTHVGVDDWAMRKGCSYGTIVVDLDRHRVVDLLPDRTAATLAGWLVQRPDIKVVARDRSTEYARGASLGAPRAVQVADRWHLLANMRQAVERWLHGAHAGLRRLPPVPGPTLLLPGEIAPFHARRRSAKQAQRAGSGGRPPTTRCGVGTPMGRRCSASPAPWAWPELPCANTRPPTPSRRGCPTARARACSTRTWTISWAGSAKAARTPWRSGARLRERGYPGTSRQVHRFVAERRTKPTRSGRKPRGETMPVPETPAVEPSLPSARQLAWLLVQPTSALDAVAAAVVARVEQDATASAVADLARRFTALVRASGVGRTATPGRDAAAELDAWITTAKACTAPAIATFASGLDGDGRGPVRPDRALEQRTGGRPDQSAEAHQAPELRASGPRSAPAPNGSRRMIHAK